MFFGQHGGLNRKNTKKIGHFRINEHNNVSRHVISEIQTATPIFSTTPDSEMPLSAWSEVARHRLFPLPVCIFDILRFRCRPMSDHVVSGISELGLVKNAELAADFASPSASVQKLFSLPVRIFDILSSRCRPM